VKNIQKLLENDWRRLSLPDLENRIMQFRRAAVRQHLTTDQWNLLDRMRKRADRLQAEAVNGNAARPVQFALPERRAP
jgi:hypothetical protein